MSPLAQLEITLTRCAPGSKLPNTSPGPCTTCTSSRNTRSSGQDDLESLQCVYLGLQGTRAYPAVQGHGETGRLPGSPVLTIVLGQGAVRLATAPFDRRALRKEDRRSDPTGSQKPVSGRRGRSAEEIPGLLPHC